MDEWTLEIVKRILEEAEKENNSVDKHNIRWVLFGNYARQIEQICEDAEMYLPENE